MYVINRTLLATLLIILLVSSLTTMMIMNNASGINKYSITCRYMDYKDENRIEDDKPVGYLLLQPPPLSAIKGPVILDNGENASIPPLDISNVFIIAYYNVGQEINITKASQLPGLVIDKWGFSYFDGRYYIEDLRDVPSDYYDDNIIEVHLRVRSDGWILAWITQNQSLTDIIMSRVSIKTGYHSSDIGKVDPWSSYGITSLSYTIFKILVQIGVLDETDSNGDGIPDSLITLSNSVGYYDYKYAGKTGSYGFLAIIGARSWFKITTSCTSGGGLHYGLFDFTISGTYTVNQSEFIVNAYLYGIYSERFARVAIKFGTTNNPSEIYSKETGSTYYWPREVFVVRHSFTYNLTSGTHYFMEVTSYSTAYGSPPWVCDEHGGHIEAFLVIVGVLKS